VVKLVIYDRPDVPSSHKLASLKGSLFLIDLRAYGLICVIEIEVP
jgi:hypothetical protein